MAACFDAAVAVVVRVEGVPAVEETAIALTDLNVPKWRTNNCPKFSSNLIHHAIPLIGSLGFFVGTLIDAVIGIVWYHRVQSCEMRCLVACDVMRLDGSCVFFFVGTFS